MNKHKARFWLAFHSKTTMLKLAAVTPEAAVNPSRGCSGSKWIASHWNGQVEYNTSVANGTL